MATQKEIIAAIRQLKEMRPSSEWRSSVRGELLSVACSASNARACRPVGVFGRAWQVSFGAAMALVLMVAAGAAVLVSNSSRQGGEVAINSSDGNVSASRENSTVAAAVRPSGISEAQPSEVVEKNLAAEKIDVMQYDYNAGQKVEGIPSVAVAQSAENSPGVQIAEKISEPDFSVRLAKERSYGDKVLGGFLMAGDEEAR